MHKLIVVTLQNEAKNFNCCKLYSSKLIKPCQILGEGGKKPAPPPPSLYETLPLKDVAGIGILSSNDAIIMSEIESMGTLFLYTTK